MVMMRPARRAGHPIAPVSPGVKDNNTKSTPVLMSINKQIPVPPGDDNGNEPPALRAGHPIAPVLSGVKDNSTKSTPEGWPSVIPVNIQ